ncbi:MAG: glucose-1-phosphate cytidylyltransferase [Muribaculaceae bacterium]|nr:glucose-1-phosphate cytidylyltransferase [Muribaculaceae bacterium]
MKAVIFAGGYGTRFSEKTQYMPKPMIEIGGKPILWHIMKIYSAYGIKEFIICAGYKQYVIKEYFTNYFLHNSDVTVNLADNDITLHECHSEDWKVTIVDTGLETMTAGRLKRVQKYIGDEPFLLTYGDGLIDLNIADSIRRHKETDAILTMTVYKPVGRFGAVEIDPGTNKVKSFLEKPDGEGNWINAGFFVCEPEVFNYLGEDADNEMFERKPLESLVRDGKMHALKHKGFWKPMDMLRDNIELEKLWNQGNAPWKVWI